MKGLSAVLVNFVNGADVRMVQGRGGLGLALETGQGLRIFGHFVGQEFEGDKTVQLDVFSFVDNAHAAATELLDHSVVRDGLADHWRKSYVCRTGESTKPGMVARLAGLIKKRSSWARPDS